MNLQGVTEKVHLNYAFISQVLIFIFSLIFRSVLSTKTEVNRDVPIVTRIKLEQRPDHRVNPQLTDPLRVILVLLRVTLVPPTANQAVILQP